MVRSRLRDGRNEIGRAIEEAYEFDQVQYVAVRTGDRAALIDGRPTVTVEEIFRQPPPPVPPP